MRRGMRHRRDAGHGRCAARVCLLDGDARGANLVEYIIIVGVVALVALVGMRAFGGEVGTKIRCLAASIAGNGASCSGATASNTGTNGLGTNESGSSGFDVNSTGASVSGSD